VIRPKHGHQPAVSPHERSAPWATEKEIESKDRGICSRASRLFLQYNVFECMIGGTLREAINGRSTIATTDERGRVA
jgi:hypothetical protein